MRMITYILISLLFSILPFNWMIPQEIEKSRMYLKMEQYILQNDFTVLDKLYKFEETSDYLNLDEKIALFQNYKKVPGITFLGSFMNGVLPGLGSLVIGDSTGAALTFFGVLGGGLFSLIGIPLRNAQNYGLSLAASYIGFGTAAVFYVNGLISPFTYSATYNKYLTISLKLQQQEIFHREKKMDAVLPLVLNILPGVGIGSFIQGDVVGGLIGLTGDSIAGVIGCIGLSQMLNCINRIQEMQSHPDVIYGGMSVEQINAILQISYSQIFTGLAIYGAAKIFEIIRPFWYAADYNKNVALGHSDAPHFAFDPYVVPVMSGDKMEMRFGLNLSMGI